MHGAHALGAWACNVCACVCLYVCRCARVRKNVHVYERCMCMEHMRLVHGPAMCVHVCVCMCRCARVSKKD